MRFFLGTHRPYWLWKLSVPLFVSRKTLADEKPKPALCEWALDSGGFTELKDNGRWTITAKQYAEEVRRWSEIPGRLAWAPVMDWMCEREVIEGGTLNGMRFVGTGLSVREHQLRTLASWFELTALAPDLPWAPVLQGFSFGDYVRHAEDYEAAGVKLASLPLVGIGSVCRRQATGLAEDLIRYFCGMGLRLHAFGFKTLGLQRTWPWLTSADSMSWSRVARLERVKLPGCTHKGVCNNCHRWALRWREKLLAGLVPPRGGGDLFSAITGCAAPESSSASGMCACSGPCSGLCRAPSCSPGSGSAAAY